MGNVSALSKAMVDDALYNTLDIKEAAILHKYLTAMGRQIAAGDAGKFYLANKSLQQEALTIWIDVSRNQGRCFSSASGEASDTDGSEVWQRCSSQGMHG